MRKTEGFSHAPLIGLSYNDLSEVWRLAVWVWS